MGGENLSSDGTLSGVYNVEYEGLHLVCFKCGRFGHRRDECPLEADQRTMAVTSQDGEPQNAAAVVPRRAVTELREGDTFGPWMLVQRKTRNKTHTQRS